MNWTTLDQYDYEIDKKNWPRELAIKIYVSDKYSVEIADISSKINSSNNLVFVEGYRLAVTDVTILHGENTRTALLLHCKPTTGTGKDQSND